MGWREVIGNILMKATDALPLPPAEPPATDPTDYLLAQQLASRGSATAAPTPAELRGLVLAAFPNLPPATADQLVQALPALHDTALDLASLVNRQQLTQAEAEARLRQALPQLSPGTVRQLLVQALVDTR